MSGNRHFDRAAVIVTALTLVLTILFMNGAALGIQVATHTTGYENRLFDNTKVHTIDIVMNDWDDMIDNATGEEYYAANVVIDGESCKNVGIRTKGNTSLSTVASLGSERYSFKIEFDHYDSTRSYHGLDKLSLNNLIQDSTMMKDYLTYTMMYQFGVDSSLCSYVYITVNGEDWGLYLAVEGVEDAFLQRNYGSDYGELYKPDSLSFGGGRGNGKDFDMGDFDFGAQSRKERDEKKSSDRSGKASKSDELPDMPSSGDAELPEGFDPSDIPEEFDPSALFGGGKGGGGGFGGGMGSSDVKLQYIDDEIDSYANIWNNAKTDITEADQTRLIESLKKLSANEEIASVVDVEQVLRYFVVHNYVCNGDSYTGSMVHNYYLYEKDGKLAMIPWDYNLAFGTFQGGNANGTVNTPIDTPVSGDSSDRPMWNWIIENGEYTELYHQYFSEFLSSVDIECIIDDAYHLIRDYVAKDPTAFYSYDAFELGVETIRQFCELRSESISLQLENNETTSDMSYADASDITLSDMGSMGGSMGGGEMPGMPDHKGGFTGTAPDAAMPSDRAENMADNLSAQISTTSDEGDLPSGFPGEMPSGFAPSNMQGGFDGDFPGQSSESGNDDVPSGDTEGNGEDAGNRSNGGNMQMPGGDFSFDMNGSNTTASNMTAWVWLAVSVAVLVIGLIAAKKYRT